MALTKPTPYGAECGLILSEDSLCHRLWIHKHPEQPNRRLNLVMTLNSQASRIFRTRIVIEAYLSLKFNRSTPKCRGSLSGVFHPDLNKIGPHLGQPWDEIMD
jgi:hypothetical protein